MKCELGAICSRLSSGKSISAKLVSAEGKYPVYGGNGLRGYSNVSNFDGECAIIGRQGAFCGNVRYFKGAAYMTEHAIVVCADGKNDTRYLAYLLSHMQLGRLSAQSAQPGLSVKTLSKQIVDVPLLETQKRIAAILSSLDDKIENNKRINRHLEQMAQALFKSWFVDFTPFCGKVPKDWKEYKLSEFLPVVTGKKNANVSSNNGRYPFFSCSQDCSWTDECSFEGNAILLAGNGDFNVKWYNGKFEAYQRTYVLIPYNARLVGWLYYAIKYNLKKITAASRGSVIKFITKGNLENFSLCAPASLEGVNIIDTFERMNQLIGHNTREVHHLTQIRDVLIPRVMSERLCLYVN